MNTKTIGERTEGFILARLLQLGYAVSMPFGDNQRYDLILDDGGTLFRCQCKTGKLQSGRISFRVCSNNWNNGTRRNYHGQIELFLVYCPQNQKFYRIPIDACGSTDMTLRVDPARNNQKTRTRLASEFEF